MGFDGDQRTPQNNGKEYERLAAKEDLGSGLATRFTLKPSKNIIGVKYHQLTVVSYKHSVLNGTHFSHYYRCQCDCGEFADVRHNNLMSGNTKSCGCLRRKNKNVCM